MYYKNKKFVYNIIIDLKYANLQLRVHKRKILLTFLKI